MVQINFGQREVSCKLVYYGPGMSGKTTNLEIIYQKAPPTSRGEMVSIATETDRTLYFDFLPLDLGQVAGMHTKFQLYTVPGQVYYNATRKLVLQGVDGVIFVADSNPDKMNENLESLENLRENLSTMGINIDEIPFVLQYNKRDLPNALSVEEMNRAINPRGVPTVEACARDGKGVFPTLKELSKLVIDKLNREHAPAAQRRRTGNFGGASGAARPAAPAPATSATPTRQAPPPPPSPTPMARPATATPMMGIKPPGTAPGYTPTPRQGIPVPPAPAPAAPPPPPPPPPPTQLSPREKHLQKAKPRALAERLGEQDGTSLGPTDPHLKKYKLAAGGDGKAGGGLVKTLLLVILTLIICLMLISVLYVFVGAVREAINPMLPEGLRNMLDPPKAQPAGGTQSPP